MLSCKSALQPMSQIISRQETCKVALKKQTLHEFLIYEAENVVRHNWSDVAIHDKRIVEKMFPGETRLWIVWELGSLMPAMYCKLTEKESMTKTDHCFSAVECYMMRYMREGDFSDIQSQIARNTSKFYFVTKGYGNYDYSVVPASFRTVMDLVFCGRANSFLN